MVKDNPNDATWLSSESGTCGSAVICRDSLLPILTDATPSTSDLASKKGWYLGMASTEQVVTSAITVFGLVTFSTHQPAVATPGLCSSLGEARVYNIGYEDAEGPAGIRFEDLAGDGLPPSPVAGMVTLDDGTTVPFVIGANPDSPLEGSPPVTPPSLTQPTSRVYWNIER
jgi:type IV pilus assembly protein PilY1